jgi:hypothetical protein
LKRKGAHSDAILVGSVALLLMILGIRMMINNAYIIGIKRNLSLHAVGGPFLILLSLVFFYVAYHSLSPFSKIREFIEGKSKK